MKIHKWKDVRARRPRTPEREAKIAEWVAAAELTLTLQELREKAGVTQVKLAEGLDMAQTQISRIERSSPRLDTLRRYIEGLGGELHIVARLDGRDYEIRLGEQP